MVIGEVDIGFRPSTLPPITQLTMVYCCVYLLLIVVFTKFFMVIKVVIVVVMIEDAYLGLKRPATLTFTIVEKVLMVMGEVDIGIIPSPPPHIIQVILVY